MGGGGGGGGSVEGGVGSGVSVGAASAGGVSVGRGSGVAVGGSVVGVGIGVSVGVGRIESGCCIAVVGVNVGNGVRVAGRLASSCGRGSRDSNEQLRVSKIKKALGMLQALGRDGDSKIDSSWLRIYIYNLGLFRILRRLI